MYQRNVYKIESLKIILQNSMKLLKLSEYIYMKRILWIGAFQKEF